MAGGVTPDGKQNTFDVLRYGKRLPVELSKIRDSPIHRLSPVINSMVPERTGRPATREWSALDSSARDRVRRSEFADDCRDASRQS